MADSKLSGLTAQTAANTVDADLVLTLDASTGVTHKMEVSEAKTLFTPSAATTTAAGIVEKSTSAENVTGTSDTVYPSVAGTKEMIDTHAAGGWEAWDGGSDPVIWDHAVSGNTVAVQTPDFEEGYVYKITFENLATSTSSADLMIKLRKDSGDWSAGSSLFNQTAASKSVGSITFWNPYASGISFGFHFDVSRNGSTTDAVISGGSRLMRGISYAAPQRIRTVELYSQVSSRPLGKGTISMYRMAIG